jgi:hypothetical protein
VVACGGVKLCTNITASSDDSCTADMLDWASYMVALCAVQVSAGFLLLSLRTV